jgi:hypothetical protein
MHEGGSRYKEIRDLYEEKLATKERQWIESKEEVIKSKMRLEFQDLDQKRVHNEHLRRESDLKEQIASANEAAKLESKKYQEVQLECKMLTVQHEKEIAQLTLVNQESLKRAIQDTENKL